MQRLLITLTVVFAAPAFSQEEDRMLLSQSGQDPTEQLASFGPGIRIQDLDPVPREHCVLQALFSISSKVRPELVGKQRNKILHGTLVDENGQTLPGVIVGAISIPDGDAPLEEYVLKLRGLSRWRSPHRQLRSLALTDAKGCFTFTDLWPGQLTLYTVGGDNLTTLRSQLTPSRLVPTEGMDAIVVTVKPALGLLPSLRMRYSERDTARKLGRLRVLLCTPEGTPYTWESAMEIFRIDSAGNEKLLPHKRDKDWSFSPLVRRDLPAGRYRVRFVSTENVPWCGTGWTPTPAWLLDAGLTVEITADRQVTRSVRFAQAGRLRLTLDDLPGAAPYFDQPIDFDSMEGSQQIYTALEDEATPRKVRARLRDLTTGSTRWLRFRIPGIWSNYSKPTLLAGWPVVTSKPIPPGSYALTFVVDGAQVPTCLVNIAHGRVTDVHSALQPN